MAFELPGSPFTRLLALDPASPYPRTRTSEANQKIHARTRIRACISVYTFIVSSIRPDDGKSLATSPVQILNIGMGQAPVKNYNELLRDMIIAGRAKPSQIVSHRLPLESALGAYQAFDQRGGEYTKVLLKPGLPASAT